MWDSVVVLKGHKGIVCASGQRCRRVGGASPEARGSEQWAGHPACAGSGPTFSADLHETSPHDRGRVAPETWRGRVNGQETGYEQVSEPERNH